MRIYGSDNSINAMSCLTLHTSRIGSNPALQTERIGGLSADASRIGTSPTLQADRIGGMSADVSRIGESPILHTLRVDGISAEISRIGISPALQAERIGGVLADVARIGSSPALSVWDTLGRLSLDVSDMFAERHLDLSCSLVCEVPGQIFLRVSPQEVQWVTVNETITYNVESNIDWNII